ncbi:MAG: response regulator, partial [Myxococcales bacterium]|nr:response regulator [Myxococcales bacterium]
GVAASIVHTLQKALYCEFVRVMILDPERDCLIDSHSTKAAKPIERHGDSAAAKICQRLQRLDIVLALDELDEMAADEPGLRLISEFLRERGTAVIVPLVHNEELVGLIELGEKRNLGSYTRTDYELINRIHSGADVALANSLLYQNLQDLTRSLEERVQERTTELRTAYDKLQELDRTKSRFFTNVTHELRTPLTLILAPLEDALLNKQLPDDQRESISMMYRQATQLHRLINDLLDLSKIDAGELRLMIAEFDLDTLLREVITSFEPLAARKSITLDFDPAGSLEPFHGDRNQLERALVNLIGNALKFTPEGGRAALRARAIGNEAVEIEVSDTGIGIPEAFLSRVFDRFAQADDDETRRFEGTGIGLALVREITELHGGRIRVDSEMGHGSTFRMRLRLDPGRIPATAIERRRVDVQTGQYRRSSDRDPLSWMADQDWAAPRMGALAPTRDAGNGAAGSSSPIGTRAVVLVVEDNTDMRRYLVELLSPSYRVITAENGRKGLDVALAELPSVIVSDVMMPEMSGLEMCASLKSSEAGRGIPVLLLTAKKGIERTLEGFESGADDYVTKPFSARELLSRVAVQVKLRRLAEQLALQEKITLMGLVSSGLAHEVKNPANAILNAVEPIRRLASPAPEEREAVGELLDAVLEGARRIVALCDDLLGLARPGEDSVGPWEPTEAIEATLRLLHLKRQESTHVERHLAHNDVPIGVRTQLSQLTMNLLGNALRAAGPEGRVVIGTANDESTFYLTIEDDGPGIPAENLARIFDPLFTTQDVGGGTGLGLYIVRRVVDLHHGVIDVESSPGNGARFRISLPLGHEQPAFQG